MNSYIYIYYMYIYFHVYIKKHTHIYMYICIYVKHIYTYVFIHIYIYIYVNLVMYVFGTSEPILRLFYKSPQCWSRPVGDTPVVGFHGSWNSLVKKHGILKGPIAKI